MENLILFLMLFINPDINKFVEFDKTNEIQYSADFDCKGFTQTFIDNAYMFDAFPVGVGWRVDGSVVFHQFVGVNTDNGVVWVEPQNDRFYIVSEDFLCYADGECVTNELAFVYIEN